MVERQASDLEARVGVPVHFQIILLEFDKKTLGVDSSLQNKKISPQKHFHANSRPIPWSDLSPLDFIYGAT